MATGRHQERPSFAPQPNFNVPGWKVEREVDVPRVLGHPRGESTSQGPQHWVGTLYNLETLTTPSLLLLESEGWPEGPTRMLRLRLCVCYKASDLGHCFQFSSSPPPPPASPHPHPPCLSLSSPHRTQRFGLCPSPGPQDFPGWVPSVCTGLQLPLPPGSHPTSTTPSGDGDPVLPPGPSSLWAALAFLAPRQTRGPAERLNLGIAEAWSTWWSLAYLPLAVRVS